MSLPATLDVGAAYPPGRAARDRFVLAHRGPRPALDPSMHQGVIVEPERSADGSITSTATVFLTGRECPWRCAMCDLWLHTTTSDTPRGAIPRQIDHAVEGLRRGATMPSVIKLYNAGSFFDGRAVPPEDDEATVETVGTFARVVVESHPALLGDRTWRLRDWLARSRRGTRLEVAMGLETAHPLALQRLNKGITVESFAAAARAITSRDIDLRVFLLIHPPFVPRAEQDHWLVQSIAVAFECGATVVSLIPTRGGNGTLETLSATSDFVPPSLIDIEHSAAVGLERAHRVADAKGRLFIDTWALERFSPCSRCSLPRQARLRQLNLEQRLPPPFACETCGEVAPS